MHTVTVVTRPSYLNLIPPPHPPPAPDTALNKHPVGYVNTHPIFSLLPLLLLFFFFFFFFFFLFFFLFCLHFSRRRRQKNKNERVVGVGVGVCTIWVKGHVRGGCSSCVAPYNPAGLIEGRSLQLPLFFISQITTLPACAAHAPSSLLQVTSSTGPG